MSAPISPNQQAVQDSVIPNQEHPIRLPMFEGPLDLLLFLIRKNEVDVYDIPVEKVTKQYLEIIYNMEKLNLDIAGDFFVMAATLMYIKSRMLLPTNEQTNKDEEEEEEVDPRWELVQQLLEYKKFKGAAHNLDNLIRDRQDLMARYFKENKEDKAARPLKNSDRIELWNTFNLVLRRLAEQMREGEINDEQVSLADRMEYLLSYIKTKTRFSFSSLFEGTPYNLNMLVATFLAILELTRIKKLAVKQSENFDEIYCETLPEEAALEEDLEATQNQEPLPQIT